MIHACSQLDLNSVATWWERRVRKDRSSERECKKMEKVLREVKPQKRHHEEIKSVCVCMWRPTWRWQKYFPSIRQTFCQVHRDRTEPTNPPATKAIYITCSAHTTLAQNQGGREPRVSIKKSKTFLQPANKASWNVSAALSQEVKQCLSVSEAKKTKNKKNPATPRSDRIEC